MYQENEGLVCFRCKQHKLGVEPEIYAEESHGEKKDSFSELYLGNRNYKRLREKQDGLSELQFGNDNYRRMRQKNIDLHNDFDNI